MRIHRLWKTLDGPQRLAWGVVVLLVLVVLGLAGYGLVTLVQLLF